MGDIIGKPLPAVGESHRYYFKENCNKLDKLQLDVAILKDKADISVVYKKHGVDVQTLRLCTQQPKPKKFPTGLNELLNFLVRNIKTLVRIANDDKDMNADDTFIRFFKDLSIMLNKIAETIGVREEKTLTLSKKTVYLEICSGCKLRKGSKSKTEYIECPTTPKLDHVYNDHPLIEIMCEFVKYPNVLIHKTLKAMGQPNPVGSQRYEDVDEKYNSDRESEGRSSQQSTITTSSTSPAHTETRKGITQDIRGGVAAGTGGTRGKRGRRGAQSAQNKGRESQARQNTPRDHDRPVGAQSGEGEQGGGGKGGGRGRGAGRGGSGGRGKQERKSTPTPSVRPSSTHSGEEQREISRNRKQGAQNQNHSHKDAKSSNTENACHNRELEPTVDGDESEVVRLKERIRYLEGKVEKYEKRLECKNCETNLSIKDAAAMYGKRLQESEETVAAIQSRLNQLESQNTAKENEITLLTNDLKEMTTDSTNLTEELQKAYSDLYQEQKRNDVLTENLRELEDALQISRAMTSDVTHRLASEMNHKISANEASLENISIKCRPMNVAEDYNLFVSNSWLDAKQALDTTELTEDKRFQFLCDILLIAENCAFDTFKHAQRKFKEAFIQRSANPFDTKTSTNKDMSEKGKKTYDVPMEAFTVYGDQLRRHADKLDLTSLQQSIKENVLHKHQELKKLLKHVDKYIEESARMCWKMVIQRPRMKFTCPDVGQRFEGEKIHPLAWGSTPGEGATIQYYQFPTLLHNEIVMVKGKVFVA